MPDAMDVAAPYDDLLDHLERSTQLGRPQAARLVAEVLTYFGESTEEYVRRRHGELHRGGLANTEIYERIAGELSAWRVRPPLLSSRQIRRIVYG